LPTVDIKSADLDGLGILAATVMVGLAASNGEARRHIKGGAIKLNDVKVDSHERKIIETDIIDGIVKISVGKKKHALLKAV